MLANSNFLKVDEHSFPVQFCAQQAHSRTIGEFHPRNQYQFASLIKMQRLSLVKLETSVDSSDRTLQDSQPIIDPVKPSMEFL